LQPDDQWREGGGEEEGGDREGEELFGFSELGRRLMAQVPWDRKTEQ
jgi:hypothetical protein